MLLRLAAFLGCAAASNERPVIGILTGPLGAELSSLGLESRVYNTTYIAASYVKFAESAGARVVPLHFDSSDSELTAIFHQINGIIFPGGNTNIHKGSSTPRFREAGQLLLNLALEANDRGDTFPIHGTCLGFQLLHVLAAGDDGVICNRCFATEGTPLALNFSHDARDSRLFSGMSSALYDALGSKKITENSHSDGITPDMYTKSKKLRDFFHVLSTNEDSNGREFVSTVEAKQYPIIATQWHPEKNNFEWGKIGKLGYEAISHSADAVLLSQYMANSFVALARQSTHGFNSSEDLTRKLIYNFAAVPDPQGYFEQVYIWRTAKPSNNFDLADYLV